MQQFFLRKSNNFSCGGSSNSVTPQSKSCDYYKVQNLNFLFQCDSTYQDKEYSCYRAFSRCLALDTGVLQTMGTDWCRFYFCIRDLQRMMMNNRTMESTVTMPHQLQICKTQLNLHKMILKLQLISSKNICFLGSQPK